MAYFICGFSLASLRPWTSEQLEAIYAAIREMHSLKHATRLADADADADAEASFVEHQDPPNTRLFDRCAPHSAYWETHDRREADAWHDILSRSRHRRRSSI